MSHPLRATMALAAALVLISVAGCGRRCTDPSFLIITLSPRPMAPFSLTVTAAGRTTSLTGCPDHQQMTAGDQLVGCRDDGLTVFLPDASEVTHLTLTVVDATGEEVVRDLDVPLGALEVSHTEGGGPVCSRHATAMLHPTVAAGLRLDAARIDFGSVPTGATGRAATLTIMNDSIYPSGSPQFTVEGEFVERPMCPPSLAPGGRCTVDLAMAPSSPGPKSGRLTVSARPGGTVMVELSGIGLP
jgi:hypothetical protein